MSDLWIPEDIDDIGKNYGRSRDGDGLTEQVGVRTWGWLKHGITALSYVKATGYNGNTSITIRDLLCQGYRAKAEWVQNVRNADLPHHVKVSLALAELQREREERQDAQTLSSYYQSRDYSPAIPHLDEIVSKVLSNGHSI